jgi:ribonuclease BN (tRNA processing enzyme)
MDITFLGTNGWYDSPTGYTVCSLVRAKDFYLVLDAGGGFPFLDRYLADDRPVYVFLSHLHLDHVIGLHALNKFNFKNGLAFLLADGYGKAFETLFSLPYSLPVGKLRYPVSITEGRDFGKLPFNLKGIPLAHSSVCWGARLECEGRVLSYAPDTGPCSGLAELAAGSNLLVTECSYRPGEERPQWPHLNPQTAASAALNGGAERLVLTHFEAARYPDRESRLMAEKTAREIFPQTVAAFDGYITEI